MGLLIQVFESWYLVTRFWYLWPIAVLILAALIAFEYRTAKQRIKCQDDIKSLQEEILRIGEDIERIDTQKDNVRRAIADIKADLPELKETLSGVLLFQRFFSSFAQNCEVSVLFKVVDMLDSKVKEKEVLLSNLQQEYENACDTVNKLWLQVDEKTRQIEILKKQK